MKKEREVEMASKKKASIEDKLVDLTELETPMVITLYGRPGSGKTTIAGSGPKPMLFIDVKDKGTESLKRPETVAGDITVCEITDLDEVYDLYDYIIENPKKYKSVVIDHLTTLQDLSHQKVREEEGKEKMSQQLYGFSSSYLKEIIGMYKELTDYGITPIFIAEDRLESGDGDGEDQLLPEVGPGIMPSVSRFLCAASRVIGHTYLQERVEKTGDVKVKRFIEYRLRLGPNPYYITKVTRPKGNYCPSYVVDPSYQDIVDIVKGVYPEPEEAPKRKKKKSRKRSVTSKK